MRSSLLFAAVVITAACAVPPGQDNPSARAIASSEAALCSCTTPPAPTIPAVPLDFARNYPRGTPLYPDSTTSIATVVYRNSVAPYDFVAYGFDPALNLTVFFVEGTAADLARFQTQHYVDVSRINARLNPAGASVFDTFAGQVIEKPPKTPVAGQEAFKIAIKSYWANH